MIDVKVPVLAESIPDATLLEWKKQPGDAVDQDELLIEVETDKVVLEVLAPKAGVLKEIVKGNGETVVSAELIAKIDENGAVAKPAAEKAQAESAAKDKPAKEAESKPKEKRESEPEPSAREAREPATQDSDLSPAVRKLVAEHRLDPSKIKGTGRGGRIVKSDVLEFVEEQGKATPAGEEPAPAPGPSAKPPPSAKPAATGERTERRQPMSRLRQRIAERLVQSQQTAAILTTFNELNMQPVMDLRSRYKETFEKTHGVRLGFMSFFAKAAVRALRKFPEVNAFIEGTEIVYHDYYDIGIAVGSPRGLVVPVLRDVNKLSFAEIEQGINDFATRAQSGGLSIDELTGGTFTISNGGVFGSLLSTPILNPPQSAILGMHKTQPRPMVEDGEIVVRPMMYLALSYDHRIVDGREAVQFLVTIKESLEDPGRMLLEV